MPPLFGFRRAPVVNTPWEVPEWHETAEADLKSDLQDRLNGVGVTHYVDAKTKGYLDQAERAIQSARKATPDGAGNQWTDIVISKGLSYARLKATRKWPMFGSTKRRAKAARQAGGANCDEYGALTYAALVAEGVQGKPVLRGHMRPGGHEFTLIGDPRESHDVVVADAWVSRAQALTWKDFEFNDPKDYPFIVDDKWNDSRPNRDYDFSHIRPKPMSMAEARRMYGVPAGETLVEWIGKSAARRKPLWEQDWAIEDEKWVFYQTQ